ncbi:hypothetical protein Cgig2_001553 [Carnegiea gigantea]|uniref:Reverse transcriptase n=1 Tax=Carnegiea gigantea TaxID=171969 RepID=A0A9Q1JMR8_9CARY|nr:hypothetical protein Cgig2_001553 [Carnegiea gigantea]
MWTSDPSFLDLVALNVAKQHHVSKMQALKQPLLDIKGPLSQLNRYFMAKIKQRKAMTCIYQLKDKHSQWVQGFDAVADIITEYYTDLLGRKGTQRHQVQPQAVQYGHTLTLEQQINLCKPFTDQEIKQALFSIPDYKSPGPDGFNSGFFKAR